MPSLKIGEAIKSPAYDSETFHPAWRAPRSLITALRISAASPSFSGRKSSASGANFFPVKRASASRSETMLILSTNWMSYHSRCDGRTMCDRHFGAVTIPSCIQRAGLSCQPFTRVTVKTKLSEAFHLVEQMHKQHPLFASSLPHLADHQWMLCHP